MTNSRQKGKRRELELCEALRGMGFLSARRSAQYCGAAGDADIADAIAGLHLECKGVEKLNLRMAMEQAIGDAKDGDVPVVIHKVNRQPWLLTIRLGDLFELCHRVGACKAVADPLPSPEVQQGDHRARETATGADSEVPA